LVQSIRMAALNYSMSIRQTSRRSILSSFFIEKVFAPPIFSQETLGAMTSHIVEICGEWRWL